MTDPLHPRAVLRQLYRLAVAAAAAHWHGCLLCRRGSLNCAAADELEDLCSRIARALEAGRPVAGRGRIVGCPPPRD